LLKLFYCCATATDHDCIEIIVAETLEEAKKKFSKTVEESDNWYAGESVSELDFGDYEVAIKKKELLNNTMK
jgi:hypothetical protein